MKHSNFKRIGLSLGFCFLLSVSGCRDAESRDHVRQARLVGNENIQLKRQVAELEKQIESLKQELDEERETRATNQQQMGEGYLKLMELLTDCRRRLRAYESTE